MASVIYVMHHDPIVVKTSYETAETALKIARRSDKPMTEFILQTGKRISFPTHMIVGIEEK